LYSGFKKESSARAGKLLEGALKKNTGDELKGL